MTAPVWGQFANGAKTQISLEKLFTVVNKRC